MKPDTKPLGYLIDECYLRHDPGSRHPESPKRLIAIQQALDSYRKLDGWRRIERRSAHREELELVHHPGHIDRIEHAAHRAPAYLDPDTVVSSESYQTGLYAAGGVLQCVEAICTDGLRRGFAFVRPPGHHAESDRAMGFCLFNNVALAAAYARRKFDLERVAIIDIDLHHGNGSQEIYYHDPAVLYVSTHQFPFYPGTGDFNEQGIEDGFGYTLNFPLPAGTGDETFVPIYSRIVGPILEQFRPDLILVSTGFDAYHQDPLGGLKVTEKGFASVAASLIQSAEKLCDGRICFVLEGGYSLEGLKRCTTAVLETMDGAEPSETPVRESALFMDIERAARKHFGNQWKW